MGSALESQLSSSFRAVLLAVRPLEVAETITFRPDEDARRALAVLTQDGTPVSTAARAHLGTRSHLPS
jgi:hypothetical protein